MTNAPQFMPQRSNYKDLVAYKKSECIYDITYHFTHRFLEVGDRTIDQMIQAARSGKQNIAEGSAASVTSSEMELKLINVAKASLRELADDYEDYLRVRGLEQWREDDERFIRTRELCVKHNNSDYYRKAIPLRTDETIANIAIIMLRQTDYLLYRLIERLKSDFLENGGKREEMTRARLASRANKH